MAMSKSQSAIIEACRAGYFADAGAENPHLFSSDVWLAWQAGRWLDDAGQTAPISALKSRGYSIRVITASGTAQRLVFAGDNLTRSIRERTA